MKVVINPCRERVASVVDAHCRAVVSPSPDRYRYRPWVLRGHGRAERLACIPIPAPGLLERHQRRGARTLRSVEPPPSALDQLGLAVVANGQRLAPWYATARRSEWLNAGPSAYGLRRRSRGRWRRG